MCKHGDTVVVEIEGVGRDIDRCIVPIVEALNSAGLETVASCCGHGHRPGNIALRDGREVMVVADYETARRIDRLFPDIHGERQLREAAEAFDPADTVPVTDVGEAVRG